MSDSTKDNKTTEIPEVSGIGTVKVDGKTVYEPSDTFIDGTYTVVTDDIGSAVKAAATGAQEATSTAKDATAGVGDTFKGYHFPKEGAAPKGTSPWSHLNKWGIWFGVILVTLGMLIFLDMLSGFVPAFENIFGGHSFWRFWPLLIVFGGLALAFSPVSDSPNPKRNGTFSPYRLSEGLFVSTLGMMLLGCSLGYVSWLMWPALLSFWPLLLVLAGLAMLSHGFKTEWFSVLSYFISIVVLVSVASSMWIGAAPLAEPFVTLAEFGSFRGMDLFNIGAEVGSGFESAR